MANKKKLNILRVVLCAVVMCVILAGMLWLSLWINEVAADKLEQLNPLRDGDMDNTLWLIEKILYILPVCVLLICQTVVYKIAKGKKSITHRERAWELIIALVFTYALLLPAVIMCSNNNTPISDAEAGAETLSLIARSAQWFMWQILIFMPVILYHRVMATSCADTEKAEGNEETEIENQDN